MVDSLKMQQFIMDSPGGPSNGPGHGYYYAGMIRTFASSRAAYGALYAEGQETNSELLWSILYHSYDPRGQGCRLPNLVDYAIVGGSPVGWRPNHDPVVMTYVIAYKPPDINNYTAAPLIGMVAPYAGGTVPDGWLRCDGTAYKQSDYKDLFGALAFTYNRPDDDDDVVFRVPDLRGRTVVGLRDGDMPGEKVDGTIPGLTMYYVIANNGGNELWDSQVDPSEGFLGEVVAWAGPKLPPGWLACDGLRLNKDIYPPLYRCIGDTWGSDAVGFRIPDLQGKIIMGGRAIEVPE